MGWVVGIAALTVVWLVGVAVVHLVRRPPVPETGPPTLELGPEPPAVANLLTHRFRVTSDAVPATLLDLAARGLVEFEHRGPEEFVCRLRSTSEATLTDYERRVVELLRKRESGGIVPPGALTTGPADEPSRWWRAFTREVVADAKARGLSRDIVDKRTFVALGIVAAVPALLVLLRFGEDCGSGYAVGALVLLNVVWLGHAQRDTPEGLEAGSRWLGVRLQLAENEEFAKQTPIAVPLWERYLAYGAALGIAPGAVGPIPMGAEPDSRAWSSYGGRWRRVRVSTCCPPTRYAGRSFGCGSAAARSQASGTTSPWTTDARRRSGPGR